MSHFLHFFPHSSLPGAVSGNELVPCQGQISSRSVLPAVLPPILPAVLLPILPAVLSWWPLHGAWPGLCTAGPHGKGPRLELGKSNVGDRDRVRDTRVEHPCVHTAVILLWPCSCSAPCPIPWPGTGQKAWPGATDLPGAVSRRSRIRPGSEGWRAVGVGRLQLSICGVPALDGAAQPRHSCPACPSWAASSCPGRGTALKGTGDLGGHPSPLSSIAQLVSHRCQACVVPGAAENRQAQDGGSPEGHGAAQQQHGCVRPHPR